MHYLKKDATNDFNHLYIRLWIIPRVLLVVIPFTALLWLNGPLLGEDGFGDPVIYPNLDFSLIGIVFINGEMATAEDCVAAFVGDELRGKRVVQIADLGNGEKAFIGISINVARVGEIVGFRIYDASHDRIITVNDVQGFDGHLSPGDEIGTVDNPAILNVVDAAAPEITVDPTEITLQCGAGVPNVLDGISASDDLDGVITDHVTARGEDVNVNSVGDYTVTYDVSDSSNNPADPANRIYHIIDTKDPTLIIEPHEVTLEIGAEKPEMLNGVAAEDECDGDLTDRIIVGGDVVDVTAKGSYTVTYEVKDSSGNSATATRTYRVTSQSSRWRLSIEVAGSGLVLQIGQEPDATENFDDGIDVISPNGQIYFDNRGQKLTQDIRSITDEANWLLVTEPGVDAIELRWGPQDIPVSKFISIYSIDTANLPVPGPSIVMNEGNTFTIFPYINQRFRIRYASDLSAILSLNEGWNLVSFPFILTNPSTKDLSIDLTNDALLEQGNNMTVWGWDGRRFKPANIVDPLTGYWIHARESKVIVLNGKNIPSDLDENITTKLHKGWNLIGAAQDGVYMNSLNQSTNGWVWGWDGSRLQAVETIEVFAGYWVYSIENDIELDLTN